MLGYVHLQPTVILRVVFEQEHKREHPKGGELCLNRIKSEETLVEGRSGH